MSLSYDDRPQSGSFENIFLPWMEKDSGVSTKWQDELKKIANEIDRGTLITVEDDTEKSYVKWVMARDDIRERITSWLDKKNGKKSSKHPREAKDSKDGGNSFFNEQNYCASVWSYTESARYATFENDVFSVAIGNRSAAFCHLGKYEESLQDIKLAIDCGYPAASLWKLHLRAVECHVAMGNNKLAQEALKKLSKFFDQNAEATSWIKPTILKRAKDLMARKRKKNGGLAKRSNSDATINPETMMPKNEGFPSASSSVILKTCPDRGRCVVATKQIKRGELLFVEKPFAWVPVPDDNVAPLCAHCCGPLDDSKIPCRGCVEASYCGRACWENSWAYHQWECASLEMNLWQDFTNMQLAFKMIIVSPTISDIRWFNDIHRLRSHADKTPWGKMAILAVNSLMVVTYLEKYTNFFQMVDIKKAFVDKFEDESLSLSEIDLSTIEGKKLYIGTIFHRHQLQMFINAYSMVRFDSPYRGTLSERSKLVDQRLGTAVYSSSSMLNHSCDPTTMHTFCKNWIIIKSMKDVAPGEEIFVSYGPQYRDMAKDDREETLFNQYLFFCDCQACEDPRFDSYKERFQGFKCQRCSGPSELLEETEELQCFDCGATSPFNFRDALKRASSLFIDANELLDWDKPESALVLSKESLAIREKYLWKYSEDMTKSLFSMGQNCALFGDWVDGLFYTEKSLLNIEEKYGRESLEVAIHLNFLTEMIVIYLQKTRKRKTNVYRTGTLEKGQEYVNRMREIVNSVSGPWFGLYRKVEERQGQLDALHQSLRALKRPNSRTARQSSSACPKRRNKQS